MVELIQGLRLVHCDCIYDCDYDCDRDRDYDHKFDCDSYPISQPHLTAPSRFLLTLFITFVNFSSDPVLFRLQMSDSMAHLIHILVALLISTVPLMEANECPAKTPDQPCTCTTADGGFAIRINCADLNLGVVPDLTWFQG